MTEAAVHWPVLTICSLTFLLMLRARRLESRGDEKAELSPMPGPFVRLQKNPEKILAQKLIGFKCQGGQ